MTRLRPFLKFLAVGALMVSLIVAKRVPKLSSVQSVAGISIDPAVNGQYLFGLELAVTDKENGFTVSSELLQVRAPSLAKAIQRAGLQNEYPLALTHGSLVVLHPKLLGTDMTKLSKMLLGDWQGQTRTYIAVADGCDAADILRADEGENLRSGALSEQIERACKNEEISVLQAQATVSKYLGGESVSLPLIAANGKGYRISGSMEIGG